MLNTTKYKSKKRQKVTRNSAVVVFSSTLPKYLEQHSHKNRLARKNTAKYRFISVKHKNVKSNPR